MSPPPAPPTLRLTPPDDDEGGPRTGQLTNEHLRRDLYQVIQSRLREQGMKPQQASRMTWGLLNAFMAWVATNLDDEDLRPLLTHAADWGMRAGTPSVMDYLPAESINDIVDAVLGREQ